MSTPAANRTRRHLLAGDWALGSTPAGAIGSPLELAAAKCNWVAITGPIPVAAALGATALDSASSSPLDDQDWWYRCRFEAPVAGSIRFDGLATITEGWIDGSPILASDSMFLPAVAPVAAGSHELLLRFSSVTRSLARKRPRPAWKTRLVDHQQLRWIRTSLLGRIPAWCPPLPIIGPWKPVWFESGSPVSIAERRIRSSVSGNTGRLMVSLRVEAPAEPTGSIRVGSVTVPLDVAREADGWTLSAPVEIPEVRRWWPHTHGDQPLYDVSAEIRTAKGSVSEALGRVGFRSLEIDKGADGHGFGLRINGIDIFSRGCCWTPPDLASGQTTDGVREALEQLRGAGMNMIRIGGTMTWESDEFHDACDALGILVWHDLMFANMDYPVGDGEFLTSVTGEAKVLFGRLQGRPSTAVICGSSEIEQQAAMLGLGPQQWTNAWFDQHLPALCHEWIPDAAYVRSSPTGGRLPFHTDRGVAHYYGVGAYRRPLSDARLAGIRFASECLAFSNVPEPDVVDQLLNERERPPHHPKWKAGIPRDPGAGWDFEDVRDHYIETVFGLNAAQVRDLRWVDPDRYLEIGRITSGEVIARTLGEWRRPGSTCCGALVWFSRDLREGAGWGLLDKAGRPKAAYWYFERAARPLALVLTDEGLNGLNVHLINDRAGSFDATLRITAYRGGRSPVATGDRHITVAGRESVTINAEELLGGFRDLTWAYRFGAPAHDVVVVSILAEDGRALATECYWPRGLPHHPEPAARLAATPTADGAGLLLESDAVLTGVAIRVEGATPTANYLSLEPGTPVMVPWIRRGSGAPIEGHVACLQLSTPVRIPRS